MALPGCARDPSCAPLVVRAMGGLRRRRVRIPRSGLGAGGLGLWTVGLRRVRGRRRRGCRRCPWPRRWCWVGAGCSRDVRVGAKCEVQRRNESCDWSAVSSFGWVFFGLPCVDFVLDLELNCQSLVGSEVGLVGSCDQCVRLGLHRTEYTDKEL